MSMYLRVTPSFCNQMTYEAASKDLGFHMKFRPGTYIHTSKFSYYPLFRPFDRSLSRRTDSSTWSTADTPFPTGAAGFGNELEDASDSTLLAVNRMTEDFFKTVPDIENEAWSNIGDTNQGKAETAKLPILVNKLRAY